MSHFRPLFTPREELANALTHGVGAALSIAGLAVLVVLSAIYHSALHVAACAIYGSTLVLLYTSSTLYHALTHPPSKRVFRFLDHSSIYLLIAGTYTPFTLVSLRGPWGWSLFGAIWALAALGIVFKCLSLGRLEALSTALYLVMGWLAVVAIRPLFQALSLPALFWIFAGGVFYTAGVCFYLQRRKYAHTLWHLFVLAGSTSHFVAVCLALLRRA